MSRNMSRKKLTGKPSRVLLTSEIYECILASTFEVNSCFLEGDIHLPPSRIGVALDISVSSCKLFTLSFVQEEE